MYGVKGKLSRTYFGEMGSFFFLSDFVTQYFLAISSESPKSFFTNKFRNCSIPHFNHNCKLPEALYSTIFVVWILIIILNYMFWLSKELICKTIKSPLILIASCIKEKFMSLIMCLVLVTLKKEPNLRCKIHTVHCKM